MSLLAPLFALGALAVALPILFHLIQRRPRGQQFFSSLMFLAPSLPRITRRSRLNHLLLLLLRAAALILMAIAFARPFIRSLQQLNTAGPSRQVAILVDRSASMRRASLWDQVQAEAVEVLSGLRPTDRVTLLTFDDRLYDEVGFDHTRGDPAAKVQRIREALGRVQPGWAATDLGRALTETLDRMRVQSSTESSVEQWIVLITDLQVGSRLDALESATWPPDIRLEVRQVQAAAGNATLHWLPTQEEDDPSLLRVRLTNDPQSTRDRLQLVWQGGGAEDNPHHLPVGEKVGQGRVGDTGPIPVKSVQVPPGQSRVVTVPRKNAQSRLTLLGDVHPFDNEAYLAPVQPVEKRLLFVGDARDEPKHQSYFLRRAQLGSLQHPVRIDELAADAPPEALNPLDVPMLMLATAVDDSWTATLRQYLEDGGRVLVVLDPAEYFPEEDVRDTAPLAELLALDSLQVEPIQADDYAILSYIDFQHPLFQPFGEPPFNDFTKIHFWRYHRLTSNHEQPWSVVARFDDGSVALAEQRVGAGRLWILATGWSPDASQLALSTKFVPLLISMLGSSIESAVQPQGLIVGQPIDLANRAPFERVMDPHGQMIELPRDGHQFVDTRQVGIYRFVGRSDPWHVAVNLDPVESRTEPMDLGELEKRGVLLGKNETAEEFSRRQRQMRDVELESRQKLWRWLLVGALSALAVETYLAGRTGGFRESTE
jgi:hypothetical protein